ncbi:MAG: transposase, partial [Undibacterium sp.]|nr:transposase [Undibacterium sp.]
QSKNKKRNQLLSKVRVRVEHVFGTWEKVIGKKVRCIGLTRANAQITVQALVYNLRRWVSIAGKNPSVAS